MLSSEAQTAMNLTLLENSTLRDAIRRNLVSFPAQIPVFMKHAQSALGEDQRRIVQLYFVCGWQLSAICARFGMGKSVVRRLLTEWRIRAVGGGYIQAIDQEALAELDGEQAPRFRDAGEGPLTGSGAEPPMEAWKFATPPQPDRLRLW